MTILLGIIGYIIGVILTLKALDRYFGMPDYVIAVYWPLSIIAITFILLAAGFNICYKKLM